MSNEMTPQQFVAKWAASTLKESAAYQEHFLDLCRILGQPTPAEVDPGGSFYTFQKGVVKARSETEEETLFGPIPAGRDRQGFADVWYHEHFAWEYKGKHKSLDKAYEQLLQYREDLQNPPLLILCDFDRFIIHTNFNNCVKKRIEFTNADLAKPENLAVLRALFENPQSLRPEKSPAAVTEEAAAAFAKLAENLRAHGAEPHEAAHFLMKLLFCLFAEDTGLLPNNVFTRIVKQGRDEPAAVPGSKKPKERVFQKYVKQLFKAMAHGGEVLMESIDHFNGGLFANTDVLDLDGDDLGILHDACMKDWSSIEPAIFGTLFERSLDPAKRSQLGAHYTSRDDIQTLVEPVLMQPLRREWADVKAKAEKQLAKRARLKGKEYAKADKALSTLLANFIHKISTARVLDPACGSGNFLYVSLNLLKELEKDVYTFAVRGGHNLIRFVSPEQLYGIEINPYAAELARLVVWIGHIQWDKNNGLFRPDDPILKPLQNIREMDAIIRIGPMKEEDGKAVAVEPQWPECDVIVGNPPFLGGKLMRRQLGDEYMDLLFGLYEGRVPHEADLCCYWFEKARAHVEAEKCKRAGLLATQGIRGGANREVLKRIKVSGDIFFAQSDRPWVLDGANVHISMVGFDKGTENERQLDGRSVTEVGPALSSQADITDALPLPRSAHIGFMGDTKGGAFDIPDDQAREWLTMPNPHGVPNSNVLVPWVNGRDVTSRGRAMWIVDFGVGMKQEQAACFEAPFGYLNSVVKKERETARSTVGIWWQHERARPDMRQALAPLSRFLSTTTVSKHRLFTWMMDPTLPDHQLIVFARSDDYFFGVLHSRFHEVWALKLGTRLETRPRYTPTTCFETFPFPEPPGLNPSPNDLKARAIGEAAKELDRLRQNWLNPPEWVKEEILEFPASVDGPWKRYVVNPNAKGIGTARYPRLVPKDADFAKELKKRTLTNLYNQRPTWLALAHQKLDAAVAAAYGWPPDIKDDEILERLLKLNLEQSRSATDTKCSPPDALEFLRTGVLPALWNRAPYASVPAVRSALAGARARVRPATVNSYLHSLLREGKMFNAGRGWYSSLKDAVSLSPEPVAALVTELRQAFPLLRFAVWSTAQVNPWLHHLIGQPVAILNAEKDALESLADRLEASNWKPALNPTGQAARRFAPHPRSVVLRPLHSAAPEAPDGLATPEQLLVELRLEAKDLGILAVAEFGTMATRMATEGRLNIGTLLRYAEKRRLKAADLFDNQLAALFEKSTID